MLHLEVANPSKKSDLRIFACDYVHGKVELPDLFASFIEDSEQKAREFDLGATFEIKEGSLFVQYRQSAQTLTIIDYLEGIAINWVYDSRQLMEWEKSFPFRSVLYHWLKNQGFVIVHGGAIGTKDGGVILAGKSGSGKSTASLACLGSALKYAGDDIVLVHVETLMAYSLYNVAKLEVHQLERFPTLAPWVSNPETMAGYKASIFVQNHRPDWLINAFKIKAILLPRFTGLEITTMKPASAAEATKSLFPSSMVVLTVNELSLFRNLSSISRAVPAYWIETGTKLNLISESIENLLTSSDT
jgi:hypothetical protein